MEDKAFDFDNIIVTLIKFSLNDRYSTSVSALSDSLVLVEIDGMYVFNFDHMTVDYIEMVEIKSATRSTVKLQYLIMKGEWRDLNTWEIEPDSHYIHKEESLLTCSLPYTTLRIISDENVDIKLYCGIYLDLSYRNRIINEPRRLYNRDFLFEHGAITYIPKSSKKYYSYRLFDEYDREVLTERELCILQPFCECKLCNTAGISKFFYKMFRSNSCIKRGDRVVDISSARKGLKTYCDNHPLLEHLPKDLTSVVMDMLYYPYNYINI